MKFLIYGDDPYRARRKLTAIRERFCATRDPGGMNVAKFQAGTHSAGEAAEALCASPFLADRKMVILEGFLRATAAEQKKLAEFLGRVPDSTVALFHESVGADSLAKSPLFPILKDEKFSEEFLTMSSTAAEKFAADEAQELGVRFEPAALRDLVAMIGTDSWALHGEVGKLAAFASGSGRNFITASDISSLVSDGRQAEIFAFVDACVEGRGPSASGLLQRLLDDGSSELQLVALLLKHYRAALAAKDMLQRGQSDQQALAKRLGMHPFPAGKALTFARNRDAAQLLSAYETLVEMERSFKSGGPDVQASLAMFIASRQQERRI